MAFDYPMTDYNPDHWHSREEYDLFSRMSNDERWEATALMSEQLRKEFPDKLDNIDMQCCYYGTPGPYTGFYMAYYIGTLKYLRAEDAYWQGRNGGIY